MDLLTGIGIFTATVLLIEGGYFALQSLLRPDLRTVRSRLRAFSTGGDGTGTII